MDAAHPRDTEGARGVGREFSPSMSVDRRVCLRTLKLRARATLGRPRRTLLRLLFLGLSSPQACPRLVFVSIVSQEVLYIPANSHLASPRRASCIRLLIFSSPISIISTYRLQLRSHSRTFTITPGSTFTSIQVSSTYIFLHSTYTSIPLASISDCNSTFRWQLELI